MFDLSDFVILSIHCNSFALFSRCIAWSHSFEYWCWYESLQWTYSSWSYYDWCSSRKVWIHIIKINFFPNIYKNSFYHTESRNRKTLIIRLVLTCTVFLVGELTQFSTQTIQKVIWSNRTFCRLSEIYQYHLGSDIWECLEILRISVYWTFASQKKEKWSLYLEPLEALEIWLVKSRK